MQEAGVGRFCGAEYNVHEISPVHQSTKNHSLLGERTLNMAQEGIPEAPDDSAARRAAAAEAAAELAAAGEATLDVSSLERRVAELSGSSPSSSSSMDVTPIHKMRCAMMPDAPAE